jgi:hypothetical protein
MCIVSVTATRLGCSASGPVRSRSGAHTRSRKFFVTERPALRRAEHGAVIRACRRTTVRLIAA